MRYPRGGTVLAGLAVAAGLIVVAWLTGGRPSGLPTAAESPRGEATIPDAAAQRGEFLRQVFRRQSPAEIPAFVTGLESLPRSLRETEVDGVLEVDASGHLHATADTRRVFDWFLSALGEEPLDTLIARMHAYFADHLSPAAAAEARALLRSYLDYKQALATLPAPATPPDGADLDAVRAALDAARALRAEHFTPAVATAFYAEDDAMNRYAIDAQEVLRDHRLTPGEQATRLAALEAALPPALADSVRAVSQYHQLQSLTESWRQRGGSAAELRQIRENLLGAAATDRLESLERERAVWKDRLDDWLAERAALRAAAGLDGADRSKEVDHARARRFSAEEQLRVRTIERIHDSGATASL